MYTSRYNLWDAPPTQTWKKKNTPQDKIISFFLRPKEVDTSSALFRKFFLHFRKFNILNHSAISSNLAVEYASLQVEQFWEPLQGRQGRQSEIALHLKITWDMQNKYARRPKECVSSEKFDNFAKHGIPQRFSDLKKRHVDQRLHLQYFWQSQILGISAVSHLREFGTLNAADTLKIEVKASMQTKNSILRNNETGTPALVLAQVLAQTIPAGISLPAKFKNLRAVKSKLFLMMSGLGQCLILKNVFCMV